MGKKKQPRVKDWNQGQKVVCPVTQFLHALVILLQFPRRGVKMWYRKKKGKYGTYGTNDLASSEQTNFSVDFATMVMCAKSETNTSQYWMAQIVLSHFQLDQRNLNPLAISLALQIFLMALDNNRLQEVKLLGCMLPRLLWVKTK